MASARSSFEYRVTGRGGKGVVAMAVNARNGALVASFPVEDSDEIMLVTDGGQLIRVPVEGIRIAGRATQGVIVFDTAEEERVVSVDRIGETEGRRGGRVSAAKGWRPARPDVDFRPERTHGRNSRASAGAGPS